MALARFESFHDYGYECEFAFIEFKQLALFQAALCRGTTFFGGIDGGVPSLQVKIGGDAIIYVMVSAGNLIVELGFCGQSWR